jgi:hypothetical protein
MYADTLARFHQRYTIDDNGCWVWHGGDTHGFNTRGQPQIFVRGRKPYGNTLAYVAAYEHYVSSIPKGMELDHTCFNAKCVNYEHLEVVTPKENKERAYQKYHARTECKYGHDLTGDNGVSRTDGRLRCRQCLKDADRRFKEKRKASKLL